MEIDEEASLAAILPADDNNKVLENIVSSSELIQTYWGGEDRKKNQEGMVGTLQPRSNKSRHRLCRYR